MSFYDKMWPGGPRPDVDDKMSSRGASEWRRCHPTNSSLCLVGCQMVLSNSYAVLVNMVLKGEKIMEPLN